MTILVGISEFETHVLQVLGLVAASKEPVLVARCGTPFVKVVLDPANESSAGKLADALVFEGDIASPLCSSVDETGIPFARVARPLHDDR